MTQFDPIQRTDALALLEQMAWGDMDYQIKGLEICLRRALEATREHYVSWEDDLGPGFELEGYDEVTLPLDVVGRMSLEERLAHVARLLRSLALDYGVGYDFGTKRPGALAWESDESSPAALLRGLNDILWMPTTAAPEA